ncbi:uncharacterized protein LOC131309966 isoform X1 [Rhododendron vialii]|uniref:uncharacterized protein LOC131309966 isoform X1 n=1 Tax=Rhododendron vialii TaxID=182163 RepID=UPI00265F697F|nr:uncharacterized protein LOC131309966 isoform X1 [Rhododendron vialii]
MAKEKQSGTVADKGNKKITIIGKGQENSCPAVQVIRERNIGVVICDEQDINLMRLRAVMLQAKAGFFVYTLKSLVLILLFIVGKAEAMVTEKQKGTLADKGKKKITIAGKRKENSCLLVPNNNVPSKVALAQRARQDRERNERLCSASPRERGQQLRREREWIIQPLQPINFPPLTPCHRPYSCFEQRTNQTNVNPSHQNGNWLHTLLFVQSLYEAHLTLHKGLPLPVNCFRRMHVLMMVWRVFLQGLHTLSFVPPLYQAPLMLHKGTKNIDCIIWMT